MTGCVVIEAPSIKAEVGLDEVGLDDTDLEATDKSS
jgi:hypothetical protein